jgi:hypothetical protein
VIVTVDPARCEIARRENDRNLVTRVMVEEIEGFPVAASKWEPWLAHASEMTALPPLDASDRLARLSARTAPYERACFLISHLVSASWLRHVEMLAADLLEFSDNRADEAIGLRISRSIDHARRVLRIGVRARGRRRKSNRPCLKRVRAA